MRSAVSLMHLLVFLLATSCAVRSAAPLSRYKPSDAQDLSEFRNNAFLAALSAAFDWTSAEDTVPNSHQDEPELQSRPPRSTFHQPPVRERSATCRNFFWKTFSTC